MTEFPEDADVSACCYGNPSAEVITEGACRSDCARAAYNQVLESLRAAASPMNPDPSEGDYDPLGTDMAVDDCRNNIRASIESWIDQLEINYDECVAAAIYNSDSMLPYADWSEPFGEFRKVVFDDWGCNINDWGCLHQAELRPFCEIDTYSTGSSCEMAGNPEDPGADGGVDDTTGDDGTTGGVAPFGDLDALITCSPATTCIIDQALLDAVQTNFEVFYDESVELTLVANGLQITGLDSGEESKALFDEFSIVNNDVISSINSTSMTTWANVADVIADIDTTATWSITIKRPLGGSFFSTHNYTIVLASPARVGPVDAYKSSGGAAGSDEPAQASCACRTSSDDATTRWGFGLLLLGTLAWHRRRR